jgi:hypothetical protein
MSKTVKIFAKLIFISMPSIGLAGFVLYWLNGYLLEKGIPVPQWLYGTLVTVVIFSMLWLTARKPIQELIALEEADKKAKE